jgi:hypothetical protein
MHALCGRIAISDALWARNTFRLSVIIFEANQFRQNAPDPGVRSESKYVCEATCCAGKSYTNYALHVVVLMAINKNRVAGSIFR